MLKNVSSLLNTRWYLGSCFLFDLRSSPPKTNFLESGIPMNDTSKPSLQIAEAAEAILGDYLIGFQLGNEPNLYAAYVSSLL